MQTPESAKTTPFRRLVRSTSDVRQPCKECARRKGKCDGAIPVCSVCKRYGRHCLYDKHSRTSLTRKHLTEVEDRLERAEALLREVFSEAQLTQLLESPDFSVEDVPKLLDESTRRQRIIQTDPLGQHASSHPVLPRQASTVHPFSEAPHLDGSPSDAVTNSDKGFREKSVDTSSVLSAETLTSTPMALETHPAAEDDFEWDEREPSWAASSAKEGKSVIHDIQGDVQKIMDGMATLAADDSNSGYLGSVSGAALLRTIWMGTNNGPEYEGDARQARRKSLQHLFKRDINDDHPSPPWLQMQLNLTRVVADTLIDAYFGLYHTTFPILHEPTFREQYSQLSSRPAGSVGHILAHVVIALGSFVLSTCSDDTDATLFAAVKGQLSIGALETGSLALVQVFGLSANYLQKRNKPNSGYNWGGVALRLAIGLGLHKEFEGWKAAPLKMEIRRRVWWCLCVLDVGSTITYGRPLNWPQVGVDTALPLNIHEKDLTSSSIVLPKEAEEATIYSYIRTQSSYHLQTIRIYNRLISSSWPSAEELLALDDDIIGGWLNTLPPFYRDQDSLIINPAYSQGHSIILWRFRNLRIIMYRPFLIRWAVQSSSPASEHQQNLSLAETVAILRCCAAAKESITSIATFWRSCTQTRLAAWYVLYFMFQASLIPVQCLRRNPKHSNAGDWCTQVKTTLGVLDSMKDLNPNSSKCRDVINRLCGTSLYSWGEETLAAPTGAQGGSAPSEDAVDDYIMTNWMTEVDTAIHEYDACCDRISSVTTGNTDWTGIGVQDWDWGLLA